MTGRTLLFYVSAAILFQVAVFIFVAVWRGRAGAAIVAAAPLKEPAKKSAAAWQGWREFRVARREYEDSDQSQCSFYLEPVDGVALPALEMWQALPR